MSDLTVASLFAGIGGFDLAFERAGAQVVEQCELDDKCFDLLTRRFPGVDVLREVRTVERVEADVIVGGFPCQDVSVAGRRAGLAGERSGLFRDFARIIEASSSRWVVVENVAGLLSSNSGADFGTVLGSLVDIGFGVAWRVLDAQFFGVPQRRRRVFVVGHRGDVERAESVLFEREGGGGHPAPRRDARTTVAALTRSGLGGGGPDDNLAQAGHLIAQPIGFHVTQGCATLDVAYSIHSDAQREGIAKTPSIDADGVARLRNPGLGVTAELAHTLKTGSPHAVASEALGVRKLMPLECERLQGFPDGWTEGYADTTRYRMLGNAVAVPVVEWIARRMVEVDAS